jgi:TonB family protein
MKKLLIVLTLLAVVSVYAQTDDKESLKQLNTSVVESYKAGKFDNAQKFAQQALEMSIKLFGEKNTETATAYSNLAIILRDRKKYGESVINLEKAAQIYKSIPNLKGKLLIDTYELLALSQFFDGKKQDCEISFLKAIEAAETQYGAESKESLPIVLKLANFFAREKKYDNANELYLKSYSIVWKKYGRISDELEKISDSQVCFGPTNTDERTKQGKIFSDSLTKLREEIFGKDVPLTVSPGIINAGVVNGKATYLAKPEYPQEAKAQGLQGSFIIKVTIDEQGTVIKARPMCGAGILEDAAAAAAMKSKFSPTLLNGTRVKVTGTLTYNFVR